MEMKSGLGGDGRKNSGVLIETDAQRLELEKLFVRKAGILHRYIESVVEKLGEGRHSKVYRGIRAGTGETVAIKVDERDLFRDEAEIRNKINNLKKLNHPAIAKLIDFVRDEEHRRSYIIMEHIAGKDLKSALADNGSFEQSVVLNWGCQILDALSYLHKMGHIHGDIKLSNIVLRPNNKDICLADFSYLVDDPVEDELEESLNNPDEPVIRDVFDELKDRGQFRREKRKDIYRVGSVLYALLTGNPPIKDASELEKRLQLYEAGVSPNVADVLIKALSYQPQDRYASAEEMLRALHSLRWKDPSMLRWKAAVLIGSGVFLALFFSFVACFRVSRYQINRMQAIEETVEAAESAMDLGDYTLAFRLIQEVADRHPHDPPLSARTQSFLTDILGVYNSTSWYRPLHSKAVLRGRPLKVCLSPDSRWTAVLIEDATTTPSAKRIQIFDTDTGEEITGPLSAYTSVLTDMVFLAEDALLYAGKDGLTIYDIAKGTAKTVGHPDIPAATIVLSADGNVAATLDVGDNRVVLYNTETWTYHVLDLGNDTSDPGAGAETDPGDTLMALNQNGTILAVSLLNGEIAIFQFREPGFPFYPQNRVLVSWPNSTERLQYEHFEGGFYGNSLFFSAYMKGENDTRAERSFADIQSGEVWLKKTGFNKMHTVSDEETVYFSDGDTVYYVSDNYTWEDLLVASHPIEAIYPEGNCIIVRYEDDTVEAFQIHKEENQWRAESVWVGQGNLIALSDKYFLLANEGQQMLSVLRWKDGSSDARNVIMYDPSFTHTNTCVYSDGMTTILFRQNEEELFQIIGVDGQLLPIAGEMPTDWEMIQELRYVRNPSDAFPEKQYGTMPKDECLMVVYAKRAVFYSARNGIQLKEITLNGVNSLPGILTDDWEILSRRNASAEVINRKTGKSFTLDEVKQLNDATQYKDYLIVSTNKEDGRVESFIYNSDIQRVAIISGICMVLPDGRLYVDNQEGTLVQKRIYSDQQLLDDAQSREGK